MPAQGSHSRDSPLAQGRVLRLCSPHLRGRGANQLLDLAGLYICPALNTCLKANPRLFTQHCIRRGRKLGATARSHAPAGNRKQASTPGIHDKWLQVRGLVRVCGELRTCTELRGSMDFYRTAEASFSSFDLFFWYDGVHTCYFMTTDGNVLVLPVN